ncbi:hypothetical protein [Arenimonas alkanexedens]
MNWRTPAFLAFAAIAFCVSVFLFEMRYVWFVDKSELATLRVGYAIFALVIIGLWAFLPSRALVFSVAIAALLFPHFFFAGDSRALAGRGIDLASLSVALGSALLFALATHLRKKNFKHRSEQRNE